MSEDVKTISKIFFISSFLFTNVNHFQSLKTLFVAFFGDTEHTAAHTVSYSEQCLVKNELLEGSLEFSENREI